jgi:hypothetical protein
MNEEQKLIQEQLAKLPLPLQKAVEAIPWKSTVNEIGLLHNLSLEQVADVERETMLIVCGFEDPVTYIDNLVNEAGLPEEVAGEIGNEVRERVFEVISNKASEFENSLEGTSQVSQEAHPGLPMVEKDEVAHEVPHVEEAASATMPVIPPPTPSVSEPVAPASEQPEAKKPQLTVPDYRYPGGSDPYREPIE